MSQSKHTENVIWTILTIVLLLWPSVLVSGSPSLETRSDDPNAWQPLLQQQAALIAQLQAKVQTMETRLVKQEAKVSFNARLTNAPNQDVATDHETVVFHVVDVNQGGGYDALTGVFTAPVAGMYEFHIKITHVAPGNMHVRLAKEQDNIAEVNADGDTSDRSSAVVVVHLAQGQRVRAYRDNGVSTKLSGAFGTTFSGFLIYAD